MNTELQRKCDLLVKNRLILRKAYAWDMDMMATAAANMFVDADREITVAELQKNEAILKQHAGVFSKFRGNLKLAMVCKMCLAEHGEAYFLKVEKAYEALKCIKWLNSEYRLMAAIVLADHAEDYLYEELARKTEDIYKGMKQDHRWLTNDEDVPFAAMLAVSGLNTQELLVEMEKDFALLKGHFMDTNAIQSLSHVLSLFQKSAEEKCSRVINIANRLKAEKHKFGTGYELPTLGTLAVLALSDEQIVQEIIAADEYLKRQKGFGTFGLGTSIRRMYAAQMVLNTYKPEGVNGDEAVMGVMLANTIALEVCMMLIMTSVVTTNAATNS